MPLHNQQREAEIERRAREIVDQMTVEECVWQTLYTAPAIERLGIPSYNWWNEALHGVARAGLATVFPQAIGLAACFDEELMKRVADVISTEGRAKYNEAQKHGDHDIYKGLTFWSPNVNLFRDPRWGRGQETYGEDPCLTARLGMAFVKGLQGDDPDHLKAAGCAKHFAVHSGPESLRHEFDAEASPRDLWETYLPAFEALATEAGVEGFMGAYNRTNGEPCCGHSVLMKQILRGKWGFEGYFTSDCWAIADFHLHHHVCDTPVESVTLAMKNGTDLNCGQMYGHLLTAYHEGKVTEEELRSAAFRLMRTRLRLGLPGETTPWDGLTYVDVDTDEHRALNLDAARKALVLLKNQDGFLPLDRTKLHTVAVIGPNAISTVALEGNYCGTAGEYHTVYDGIREALPQTTRVYYAQGSHLCLDRVEDLSKNPNDRISEAVAIASRCELVILAVGLDQYIEGEEMPGSKLKTCGDKADLLLPEGQRALITAIGQTGVPTVIVNMSGSAIDLADGNDYAKAIIQAWYPGAEGGRAVAQLIFGDYSPSGRLPVTFYRNDEDLPAFTDYAMTNRTYRFREQKPLYPFGYGLSYTRFAYSGLRVEVAAGEPVRVFATVQNIGGRAGDEIVQAYIHLEDAGVPVPLRTLAAFRRASLKPGERREVELKLLPSALYEYEEDGARHTHSGQVRLWVGGRQPDERSRELTGTEVLETLFTLE